MKSINASSFVATPSGHRALPATVLRVGDAVRAAGAHLDRWRRRRATAAALDRLTERELRDIGLVRLADVGAVRYDHTADWL